MSKSKVISGQQAAAAHETDKALRDQQGSSSTEASARHVPPDDGRHERIAVRAYYHAERRGFLNDAQLEDWLTAEREIDNENRSSGKKQEASMNSAKGSFEATAQAARQGMQRGDGGECIEPDQVQDWAQRLGVTSHKLREAMQRVGSKVQDVMQDLESVPDRHPSPQIAEPAVVAGKTARATRKKKSDVEGARREP